MRNWRRMTFGDGLRAPATVAAAEWIGGACRGTRGTVGALVPNGYLVFLRVRAPDPTPGDWWSAYRALFEVVASIGARHTGTADRAWFGVWEGHGFTNAATRVALNGLARFHLPNRTYYLLEGSVSAVAQLRYPDSPTEWRNPDLFWPDDRRWFLATDVDFWSLYIGGDEELIADLRASVPTTAEPVTIDRRLEIED